MQKHMYGNSHLSSNRFEIRFFFRISNWSLMCSFNFQASAMRGLAMWMATPLGTASDGIVEKLGPICCFSMTTTTDYMIQVVCLMKNISFFVCVHRHTCWVWLSFFSEVWLSVLKKCSVSTTACSLKIARQNKRTNCYSENVTNKGTTHLDCSWIHAAHKHDISRTSSWCSLLSFISIIKLTKDTYFQSCHCARVIDLTTLCDILVKTLGDLHQCKLFFFRKIQDTFLALINKEE